MFLRSLIFSDFHLDDWHIWWVIKMGLKMQLFAQVKMPKCVGLSYEEVLEPEMNMEVGEPTFLIKCHLNFFNGIFLQISQKLQLPTAV